MSEKIARHRIGFPLLVKELTELANQKRTYVIRFLYAAVLFAGGLLTIQSRLGGGGGFQIGIGGDIFRDLVEMQFWLVLLFLPSTASGAMTIEKERDSLALLLLTTMPSVSIVFQKFLSRLMPMVSFLLLAFPLLAVAYSYGGVATEELLAAIVLLLIFAAEVCAVCMMCSAYCRTTAEALVSSYAVLILLYLVPPVWPPHVFDGVIRNSEWVYSITTGGSVSATIVMVICLAMACHFLQSRAFVPPRNVLLQAFQWLDGVYNDWNALTGGVVLVNDGDSLPETDPVAWRETAKKSLGTFRYLFRVCTVLVVPILFTGASINISMVRSQSSMSTLLYILWCVSIAMICVHASGVITAERSRQTLDVLLTTTLTGADLLEQKMAGVQRLLYVLMVPFLTVYGFQTWFRGFDWAYTIGSLGTMLIFLPLAAWMSLYVGLKIRSTIKAILTSIGVVLVLCLVPYLIAEYIVHPGVSRHASTGIVSFSPVRIVTLLETKESIHRRIEESTVWLTLLPLLPDAWLARRIRRHCLNRADVLLQRVPTEESMPPATAEPSEAVPAPELEPA